MDSLQNIIARHGAPEQPELVALKEYVHSTYHVAVSAAISNEAIVVTVPSASLANTLRLRAARIQEACGIQKRLIFRIG